MEKETKTRHIISTSKGKRPMKRIRVPFEPEPEPEPEAEAEAEAEEEPAVVVKSEPDVLDGHPLTIHLPNIATVNRVLHFAFSDVAGQALGGDGTLKKFLDAITKQQQHFQKQLQQQKQQRKYILYFY